MTPAGIEPATFRFVAQHINQCATAVPRYFSTGTFLPLNCLEDAPASHKLMNEFGMLIHTHREETLTTK